MSSVVGVLLANALSAQEDAPPLVQATAHFYNAVGRSVTATWSTDRNEVSADGELIATLTIRGATNPHRVRRPNLRELEKFPEFFQITHGDDPPADPDATEVRFTYRLRPRSIEVDHIPAMQFGYYNPAAKRIFTTYANKLPIRVLPTPAVTAPVGPLEAPERFFRLADNYRGPTEPGLADWLGLMLAVPLATAVWILLWRLRNPEGVRLARLQRNRAVAKALDALSRAAKSADPAANAAAAVRVYLTERWGMSPAATVPAELAESLRETKFPAERIEVVAEFFRECDAARFAPVGDAGLSLVEDARKLILDRESPT